MQVTVSLIVDVPASADSNQIEQAVQEAGKPPMREATQKAVRAVEGQNQTCLHCGSEAVHSGCHTQFCVTVHSRKARKPGLEWV